MSGAGSLGDGMGWGRMHMKELTDASDLIWTAGPRLFSEVSILARQVGLYARCSKGT
jgi:hypothetical protein